MKNLVRFSFLCLASLHLTHGVHAQSISAPIGSDSVSYSAFADKNQVQLWNILNEMNYWEVPLTAPADYYDNVNVSDNAKFRQSLHDIIDDHKVFPYSHSSKPGQSNHKIDTWDIVMLADAHPSRKGKVLDIYFNNTFDRQLFGVKTNPRYDREHSWPKSLGFKSSTSSSTTKNPAYTDCHHLYAAYNSYNSTRSNKAYGNVGSNSATAKPTIENLAFGGSLSTDSDSSNSSSSKLWETWIGRRGDVARAMFYMALRYEGGEFGHGKEADLKLTNDLSKIVKRDSAWENGDDAYMGLLDDLLQWHQEDPVDDLERRHNTVVYLFQGNRNPFVDHPEWVDYIYKGKDVGEMAVPESGVATAGVWINEIHYDNVGADQDEFVEIAGKAGINLDSWTLVGYNGNGGRIYKTINLEGIIPDESNGHGALAFEFSGLQNGGPDGIALIDANNTLVEFISYEGKFSGAEGPAFDEASDDIDVTEVNAAIGDSLQRIGHQNSGNWKGPQPATKGKVNSGQTF